LDGGVIKKKMLYKNMTIYSLKCYRCNKINCSKWLKCIHCKNVSCLKCIDETNPLRLKYKVFKNGVDGIEQTIYCTQHCMKPYNYCNDCGGNYNSLKNCSCCLINFCSVCQDRNMGSLTEFMLPGDINYNSRINQIGNFYCSKGCFKINYMNEYELETVCNNCGECFWDIYNHGECHKCLTMSKIETDVSYDKKRFILQQEIIKLISREKIKDNDILDKIGEYMKEEIEKNEFADENKIKYRYWLYDLDSGSTNSMVMMDNCIIKILEEFGTIHQKNEDPNISLLLDNII